MKKLNSIYSSNRLFFLGVLAAFLAFSAFSLFYVTDTYASNSAYQDNFFNQTD